MDGWNTYFDAWLKSQEKMVDGWMEASRKLPDMLFESAGRTLKPEMFSGKGSQEVYQYWLTETLRMLSDMQGTTNEVMNETFSKMTGSSNVYVKLYEIWVPLAKALQERISDPKKYRDLVDPAKYKEVIDSIFGFTPESLTEFSEQTAKVFEAFKSSVAEFAFPWARAVQKNVRLMPEFGEAKPETSLHIFHNLFRAFDDTIGKVFHIPPVGKDREKIELMMRGSDDLAVFFAKYTEYQNAIYIISLRAMEKVAEEVAARVSRGEPVRSFNEFFDLWVDTIEREYHDLFKTREFADLQNQLLNSSLNVRGHFYKLMELYLFDFPVALRSEMDDLYRTVYDLRKKVKNLERQLTDAKETAA